MKTTYRSLISAILFIQVMLSAQLQAQPTCVPLPSGAVSWWRAEGNPNDSVGSNNGIISGGVTFATGEVGQSFVFDGLHADVTVPASPSLDVGKGPGLTIEAWVNPADMNSHPIFDWSPNGAYGVHFWESHPGPGILYAALVDTNTTLHIIQSAPGLVVSGSFQHMAVTYDKASGMARLFLNAVIVAEQNLGTFTPLTYTDLQIGYRLPGAPFGEHSMNGLIDEATLYGRALDPSEILAIYNAGSAGKCLAPPPPPCLPAPTNLVSWWRGEGSALDSWDHNKGELHGVAFAPGEVGQAFSFNGTSDYVHIPVAGNLPDAANLNVGLGDGLTLDAWVNPSDVGNGHPIIEWSQPVGGAPYGVHLWVGHPSHPPGYFYANIADTGGNWHVIDSDPGLLQSNVFQHVAVTYNKTTGLARLFLNGAIMKETNLGIFTPQTSYELYFGERPPGDINSRFYAGLIDEIDVFSRALEPAEIQAIYNAGSTGKCVVNRPPVAGDFRAETMVAQPVTIPTTTFIAVSSDPDEDTLTLASVSNTSTNGGTVLMNASGVTYTPSSGFIGTDCFNYTITDGNGGTGTASVLVQVDPSPFAAHLLPPAMVGGQFQLNFSGYPGGTYTLQRAESLAGPWVDLGTATVDGSGNGTLVDPNPLAASAFYRAVYH